jgi:predicted DNA-binding transcriptional regulator YafY
LIRGREAARVRIWFDEKVARYVQRRQWHPSQRFRRAAAGIEMTLDVQGTTELVSWVLGFGDKARVVEPEALRLEVGRELARAAHHYA